MAMNEKSKPSRTNIPGQAAAALWAWSLPFARSIQAVGTPDFWPHLESTIATLVQFDICMVFAYCGSARPFIVYDNLPPALAQLVVHDYLLGPYLLDPFYNALCQGKTTGTARLREIATDRFMQSDYFIHHYQKLGISDEFGFFIPTPDRINLILSITRSTGQALFSAADRRLLTAIEPMVRALASGQRVNPLSGGQPDAATFSPATGDGLLPALAGFGTDLLTSRESEIVDLILKGHSTNSIAATLRISSGTVKTHRKNIYRKFALSSQAELFSLFIAQMQKR
jgi:DNA-binding CsgD family transcriptional regulator